MNRGGKQVQVHSSSCNRGFHQIVRESGKKHIIAHIFIFCYRFVVDHVMSSLPSPSSFFDRLSSSVSHKVQQSPSSSPPVRLIRRAKKKAFSAIEEVKLQRHCNTFFALRLVINLPPFIFRECIKARSNDCCT